MEQRIIIEMGMGNDLHGMDYQKGCRPRDRGCDPAFDLADIRQHQAVTQRNAGAGHRCRARA